jgi:hypothetical protein
MMDSRVFCTIQLDRKGNVIEVLDSQGKSRPVAPEGEGLQAEPGKQAPSGKKIKYVVCIEVVTVDNKDHEDDPCWIRDPLGNWRCVCGAPFC